MNRSATAQGRRLQRRQTSAGSRVVGFFGELMITLGILLMLYVVWELWWTNIDSAQAQKEVTANLVEELGEVVVPEKTEQEEVEKDYGPAPVTEVSAGETFGIMYFPRFGANGSHHPVTYGVEDRVIDNLGIGYYPTTQQPGEMGNFAVAAHRQTHGQVFWDIDKSARRRQDLPADFRGVLHLHLVCHRNRGSIQRRRPVAHSTPVGRGTD